MSDPFLHLQYTPDIADALKVARRSTRHHYSIRQRALGWLPLLALVGFLVLLGRYDRQVATFFVPLLGLKLAGYVPLLIVIAAGAIYVWLVCYHLMPALSARWIEERKPPKPMSVTADDDEICWDDGDCGYWLKWGGIERMFLTPEGVCLLNGGMSFFIARCGFADDAQLAQFARDVLRCLPEKARAASLTERSVRDLVATV